MSKKKSRLDKKTGEKKNLISQFTEIVRTRWKYIVFAYFLGYVWSLFGTGVPNLYYLIPIKVFAVASGWLLGNCMYHGANSPYYKGGYYAVIHTFISLFLAGIAFLPITVVCWGLGIDPTPFYGFK